MAEQQTIKYAPQWNNMTVDNVLGGSYSSTEQVNSIQQLVAYSLITGTEADIQEIIYSDLDPSKVTKIESTAHMIAEEELSWNSSNDEGADDQEKIDDDDEGKDSEEGEEDDDDNEDKNGYERDDDDQDQEIAKHDDKDD
nr:hypothetical protein [Tanacetum cinerariifolium]